MSIRLGAAFEAPFWGRGFRPFFFLGALYGVVAVAVWGAFYAGWGAAPPFAPDPVSWHAHEMIYGFGMAIVAGFLLTAVANWTGGAPARRLHLAALAALWLAGRGVMAAGAALPAWLAVLAGAGFILALAVTLAVPLVHSRNRRNFIFLAILGVLAGCEAWFLLRGDMRALYAAMAMILAMVSLVGGRVIPAFTVAALRRRGVAAFQTPQGAMDAAALATLAVLAPLMAIAPAAPATGAAAGTACVVHALRMRHYHTPEALRDPLLWILHAGYAWLVLGLGLLALGGFGLFDHRLAVHALTAGSIGSMTLGMICRVTLGHTGRELRAGPWAAAAFCVMQAAALLRVFGPTAWPAGAAACIAGSAFLWAACFAVYLAVYGRMLFAPRPDGRPA